MNEKRLTHAQIRAHCRAEERKDFVTCPVDGCGGHLHLFGKDDFACMGNSAHAPCKPEVVAAKLHNMINDGEIREHNKAPKQPEAPPAGKLMLVDYAMSKHLHAPFLQEWYDAREGKHPYYDKVECGVCLPYWNERGEEVTQQWRWGMGSKDRKFLKDKPTYLYGGRFLRLLEDMAHAGNGRADIFLVEGESNTHTLSQNGFPTLGLPGVRSWKEDWAKLQCLNAAKRLYFWLDMKDGKPEDVAILGARKVAGSFNPGKVLAVKVPQKPDEQIKDISDLWLFHMTSPYGGGLEGFRSDIHDAVIEAKPIIPIREEIAGLPPDLGAQVLKACPILEDFVALTAPHVETDVNNIIIDFLACAGVAIGMKAYAMHVADKHPPVPFYLVIGNTTIGKGTSFNCAHTLFSLVISDWKNYVRRSARSQQGLYRLVRNAAAKEISFISKTTGKEKTVDNKRYTEGRLLVRFSEVSAVFKSMRAEWSTLAEGMREVYDGNPLSNEKGDQNDSITVDDPYSAALLGDVTPWELSEVIEAVDFRDGVANRFLWSHSRRTKTITRGSLADYTQLAERLKLVIPEEPIGEISFSEAGAAAWDTWVYTLPFEDEGKLADACGRARANALRLAVLFAILDESRLILIGPPQIEARHVQAAAAILDRHRETVAWFLARPANVPEELPEAVKSKLWRQIEKLTANLDADGTITGSQLYKLFSNQTVEERRAIAEAAGLREEQAVDSKGNKFVVWR